ncbi:MAG TPA: hypothetical protein DCY94_00460, partial [Firmicutes bacterium]|nr:hypothetical protein [Bacillota bacterium]
KLYLYTVSSEEEEKGLVFAGNYFGNNEDEPNLKVVACDVNPKLAKECKISYQYRDYYLDEIKQVDRKVIVKPAREADVISFSAVINNNKKIIEKTPIEEVPIQITENYADGSSKTLDMIPITEVASQGYSVDNFQTETIGAFDALVTRLKYNTDGSKAASVLAPYRIISSIFTVTFNATGGEANPTSKEVKYESTFGTLASAMRTGYTFTGWFLEDGRQIRENTIYDFIDDITLYAHWKPNDYKVLFNGNGGTPTQSSKIVTYDSTYGTMPTATRTGYDFAGWYTASSGGNEVTESTRVKITATTTLYAHWEPKEFKVNFDPRGGSVSPTFKSVKYDSTYGAMPVPVRSGCKFEGWYTDPSGGILVTSSTRVKLTRDQTLYARWSKTYTVTFNNNGSITKQSCNAYSENFTCQMSMPSFRTNTYYRALGWNKTAGSSVATYRVGTSITVDRDMTLYSVSEFDDFPLRLDSVSKSMSTSRIESNINLMFIVDMSGSMLAYNRIDKTISVMNSLIGKLGSNSTVSIVTHADGRGQANLLYGSPSAASSLISRLYVRNGANENYTAGIDAALGVFSQQRNDYPNYTVFITDASYASDGSVYISASDYRLTRLHSYSTTYTVGIGEDAERWLEGLLRDSIASSPSKHYRYRDASSMSSFYAIFDDITRDILTQVPNETTQSYTSYSRNGTVTVGYIGALSGYYPFEVYLGNRLIATYYSTNSFLTRSGSYYYFDMKRFLSMYGSSYGISDYNKSTLRFKFYNKI